MELCLENISSWGRIPGERQKKDNILEVQIEIISRLEKDDCVLV